MASLHDEINNQYYPIEPEVPIIIGRGVSLFNITDPRVGRQQIELTLLNDGRCYVKRIGHNPSNMKGKALPRNQEIQVYDGDVIELIPRHHCYRLILPNSTDDRSVVIPPTAPSPMEGEKYYYDENNMDEYQTQQPSFLRHSINTQDDDEDEQDEMTTEEDERIVHIGHVEEDDENDDGWITSESSLLGGEDWSDIEGDLKDESENHNRETVK